MLYDETVVDTEPCKFGDPDDAARAINTLLERRAEDLCKASFMDVAIA